MANIKYIRDYGAKGDGVTDDFPAVSKAFADLNAGDALIFESNKTYCVRSELLKPVMGISGADKKKITIKGDHTTLLLDPPLYYMNIQ